MLLLTRKSGGEQNTSENLSNGGRAERLLCSPFCIPYPCRIFLQGENSLAAGKEVVILCEKLESRSIFHHEGICYQQSGYE